MEHPKKPPSPIQIDNPMPPQPSALRQMFLVASIAAGIQFGWALQLSLLTPYVQLLGVPHMWSAFIWLCGPISGLFVQPTVGYYSDRCTSRFGRRRPFIAVGVALVSVAVFLIGFAADIGHASGDPATPRVTKPRAIAVFVVGFWVLDVANNTLQGPCRAFLADLAAGDDRKTRTANSAYSFFMAVGNVLGFAAGSFRHLYRLFPFTATAACDTYCANLKSCFFISVFLLVTLTAVASFLTSEIPISAPSPKADAHDGACGALPFVGEIVGALRNLKKPMLVLMLVTCLNWIAWFPFILFDTDWMGKEVYGGKVGDRSYDLGVRAGSLGLMLNSVVLGLTSLSIEPVARALGGAKRLWGLVNLVLAVCLAMMVVVTKMAEHDRHQAVLAGGAPPTAPPGNIKAGALALFSLLGIPLSITYSVPFALASIFSTNSGAGQGLSLGVLNLAIVVPQILVSTTSGPWDALFGGGNLPAFVAGAVAAATSAVLALTVLPSPPPDVKISGGSGGH